MAERLKVVFVTLSTGKGGAEKVLAECSIGLDRDLFEPLVISLKKKGNAAFVIERRGVPVYSLGMYESPRFLNILMLPVVLLRLLGFVMKQKPDLIYTYMFGADILGGIAGSIYGIPVIVSLHTVEKKRIWQYPLRRFFDFTVAAYCPVSKAVECFYREIGIVSPEKTFTITNAVNLSPKIDSDKITDLRNEFGIGEDVKIILCAGRLEPEKDFITAIKAFKIIAAKIENIMMIIAGEGSQRRMLEIFALKQGKAADKIVFTGYREDMDVLFALTDVFVMTSAYEGMPMVVLEAMAAGKPVVSTDFNGADELVSNEETGFLVQKGNTQMIADKITLLISNDDLRRNMGGKGREKAAKKHCMKNYISMQQDLFLKIVRRKYRC